MGVRGWGRGKGKGGGQISCKNCRCRAAHGAELSNAAGVGEGRVILVSAFLGGETCLKLVATLEVHCCGHFPGWGKNNFYSIKVMSLHYSLVWCVKLVHGSGFLMWF